MDGINSGDTAWIIVATALVLMMTPALGFFYGGMVRRKNILSTLNLSFITIGLISIQWVVIGYTLAFGTSVAGLVGGLDYIGLSNVGVEALEGLSIPHLLFAAFQMTFAIITPALISGTFVERIRFKVYLVFAVLWATLVYDPVCHWAWGGGIFARWGALVRSSTSRLDSRRWRFPWQSASARGSDRWRSSRTTSHSLFWGQACCG